MRVAGVSVGKVRDEDARPRAPQPHRRHDRGRPASSRRSPRDARAILRQKTLLGETYVELTPGNKRAAGTVPDGGFLADARVAKTVELDEIFQALDPKTRASFQRLAAGPLQGGRRPRARPQRRARATCPRFADDGNDLLDRARRPVAGGLRASCAAPARSSARSRRTRASCTTSSSTPATPSTPPRASRRRWPRRSGSSRPSSTSPRRPSSAWSASPRTPTRSCRTCARPCAT